MEIPHLGTFTKNHQFGWYYSSPIPVPVLGNIECRIVLEDYDGDQAIWGKDPAKVRIVME